MARNFLCFFALLFSCCTLSAQNPAPGTPAPDTPAPATPASVPNSAPKVVQAGVATTNGPEVEAFQKIENNWSDAVNDHDQYALELVLSPLFIDISASGDITTRNQQLAGVISQQDKTLHIEQRVVTVRMLGDIAVANGTYVLHHKVASGPIEEKGVFTHVFERNRTGWICVNSQRTVLREESPTSKKKKSESELPFHIPLFSKSDKQ
jgi:ketosteroid isomerase-like protein